MLRNQGQSGLGHDQAIHCIPFLSSISILTDSPTTTSTSSFVTITTSSSADDFNDALLMSTGIIGIDVKIFYFELEKKK